MIRMTFGDQRILVANCATSFLPLRFAYSNPSGTTAFIAVSLWKHSEKRTARSERLGGIIKVVMCYARTYV